MPIYIDDKEVKALMDELRAVPISIGTGARDTMNQFAEDVMAESKTLVPYDPLPKLQRKYPNAFKEGYTKHLKDSAFIRYAKSVTYPTTYYGYGAPHAWLVENDIAGRHRAEKYSTFGTGAKYLARPTKKRELQLEAKLQQVLEEVCKRASS
jgi:hypothetical protein